MPSCGTENWLQSHTFSTLVQCSRDMLHMPQLFNITLEHIIRKKKKITISLLDAIKEVGLETNTVHISSPKCRRSHNV